VELSLVEAAKWNFIAKAGGIDDAVLDKMLAKLSRADLTKAQVAAEQWRDRAMVGLE
jgi:DNA-binding IscR family transcriptional regulator